MRILALVVVLVGAIAGNAVARDITVGVAFGNSTVDPLFQDNQTNLQAAAHIFDRLIHQDHQLRLRPGLATAWRSIDNTTWEFDLRRGVRFHDGPEFTAEDVVASVRRANEVENSPASFTVYTRPIDRIEIVDPHRIRIKTVGTFPLLPNYLGVVSIVSRAHATQPTAAFNSGKATFGTGPFRFVSWTQGERLVVERNPDWWGGPVELNRVVFRVIPNNSARVAALLSEQVQVIDAVPSADIAHLQGRPDIALHRMVSNRVIYLALDQAREQSPYVSDLDGKPIPNPLRDPRVRQALTIAVNRDALAERVHLGQAIPAGGVVREGFLGYASDVRPPVFDPERGRQLLAEAGYPNGFALTIVGPNDRYLNDQQTLQAIGAMFMRIGVRTRVETIPWSLASNRIARLDFSVGLQGFSAITGEASSPLRGMLATFDRDLGNGTSNRGRYLSPKFDDLLKRALATIDDGQRGSLLQEATRTAANDAAVIPLYFGVNVWATHRSLVYDARTDDQTLAAFIRPVN